MKFKLFLFLFLCSAFFNSVIGKEREILNTYKKILELMHGEAIKVTPNKAYCLANKTKGIKSTEELYAKGDCSGVYTPNVHTLATPLTNGYRDEFLTRNNSEKLLHLIESLAELNIENLPSIDKLELQSTFLEIILVFGSAINEKYYDYDQLSVYSVEMDKNNKPLSEKELTDKQKKSLSRIVLASGSVLKRLLFTEKDFSNLKKVEKPLQQVLLENKVDSSFVGFFSANNLLEDLTPPKYYSAMNMGRFYQRIYLGLPNDKKKLSKYIISNGGKIISDRVNLKEQLESKYFNGALKQFYGLRDFESNAITILVLFFNALNHEYDFVPTKLIAKISIINNDKALQDFGLTASKRFDSLEIVVLEAVRARNGFGAPNHDLIYRVDESDKALAAMSIQQVVNTKPFYEGAKVSTVKAACFSCHAMHIKSFTDHRKKLLFSKPDQFTVEDLNLNHVTYKIKPKISEFLKNAEELLKND